MNNYLYSIFNLENKVVVITGGAGQLGGQYTRAFLSAGCKVAALDCNLDNPKGKLFNIKSPNCIKIYCDILNKKSVKNALKKVCSDLGDPDILVNNAALDAPPGEGALNTGIFETYPEKAWDSMMDVNLKGTFLCCQIFGGYMASKEGGSIINISSIYGVLSPDQRIYDYRKKPFFKPVAYSVSKSGILGLTRYLATYWAAKKVRVNTLTLAGVFNNQDKKFLENYCSKVPLGRMAREDEYNGVVLFLASDASSYMTGTNTVVDGGFSAW
jgi:NAD(P)-dependent dehydrogenase (short-subunit alcohol dehydrogenase family)